MEQKDFMNKAIQCAVENIDNGGGPFGAVIVKNGEIIAETGNSVTKTNDPTAHAEVNAIRMAAKKLGTFDLSGCEIYSSCEPCPMCLGAIYWARLDKLYFAATKTDAKNAGFDDSFIYDELELDYTERSLQTTSMMQQEALTAFNKWREFDQKIEY
jgi:tRNA(Arg) A34 adenosine deaminase TadA